MLCRTRNTQDPPNNTIIVLVQKNRETKKQRAASKIYPGVKVEEERRVFGIVGLKIQKCHVETGWLECDDMASVWGNRCLGRRWGIYEFNYNARDFSQHYLGIAFAPFIIIIINNNGSVGAMEREVQRAFKTNPSGYLIQFHVHSLINVGEMKYKAKQNHLKRKSCMILVAYERRVTFFLPINMLLLF